MIFTKASTVSCITIYNNFYSKIFILSRKNYFLQVYAKNSHTSHFGGPELLFFLSSPNMCVASNNYIY